jgi:hypothetical protein
MKKTNHLLHLVLVFFTAGLWLFVYIPLLMVRALNPETPSANQTSRVSNLEPPIQGNTNQPDIESDGLPSIEEVYERTNTASNGLSAKNLGYRQGTSKWNSFAYYLNCGHIIRDKQGMSSSANKPIGKKVFCVVCSAPRDVMGQAENVG